MPVTLTTSNYHPVKHGYVAAVAHWSYSTFHRWVKAGSIRSIGVVKELQTLPLASVHDNPGYAIRWNAHKGLPPYAGYSVIGTDKLLTPAHMAETMTMALILFTRRLAQSAGLEPRPLLLTLQNGNLIL
jgi:hypothetical protein